MLCAGSTIQPYSPGDVCLLLSCGRLLTAEQLALHRHNLVVHESALPQGQGWSTITLFEATANLDAGPIYLQQQIELQGHGLVEEWCGWSTTSAIRPLSTGAAGATCCR